MNEAGGATLLQSNVKDASGQANSVCRVSVIASAIVVRWEGKPRSLFIGGSALSRSPHLRSGFSLYCEGICYGSC